jgi:hypothetical protein
MALQGKLIKWLKAERNYVNPVNGVDYSIINSNPCPVIPGNPIVGLPDGEEWLANYTVSSSQYDQRIWVQMVTLRPTNIPHPTYPVYNQYQTSFSLQKRSENEIINAIIAKKEDANSALQADAGGAIFMANALNAIDDKQRGVTISADQIACIDRLKEVTAKMNNNAEHANNLIALLKSGGEPDLDAIKTDSCEFGWEYDRLAPCGFPLQ